MDMDLIGILSRFKHTGSDARMPDGTGFFGDASGNYRLYFGSAAPTDGVSGYAVGCDWCDGSTGNHYYNKGTTASAVWKLVTVAV